MEMGHRLRQREAEAGAAGRARAVEPPEAAPRLRLIRGRDAGAAIGDAEPQPPLAHPCEQHRLAALAGIMKRIVEQIAERLREQLAMAGEDRQAALRFDLERA